MSPRGSLVVDSNVPSLLPYLPYSVGSSLLLATEASLNWLLHTVMISPLCLPIKNTASSGINAMSYLPEFPQDLAHTRTLAKTASETDGRDGCINVSKLIIY